MCSFCNFSSLSFCYLVASGNPFLYDERSMLADHVFDLLRNQGNNISLVVPTVKTSETHFKSNLCLRKSGPYAD